MSEVPKIKSYDEYLEEALRSYLAKVGVTDLSKGSAVMAFFEANTQLVYRATGTVLQVINDNSVDRATGDVLKNLAIALRVPLKGAVEARSIVTIKDTSFEKITTKIYAGRPAPNVSSTKIYVGDASNFPPTGNIYIGRGTSNIEGPLPYSSITPVGSYWEITLVNPTIRFHNISEVVTLAQGGNRQIYANSVVQNIPAGAAAPVKYIIADTVMMLDGENEISNVAIIAQEPGSASNQPINAVRQFVSLPFPGATVTNPNAIISGRDDETDESLRTRIKQSESSKGLGSATAIKYGVIGAQAPDETASVASSQVVKAGATTTLYVDDNSGYERKTQGVGLEYIVDSALGGENVFKLATSGRQTSVSKAFLLANQEQPYDVYGGDSIGILVGGVLSQHQFDANDFQSEGAATAYEIVASINANPTLLFEATTADSGSTVALKAKANINDYLQVSVPTFGNDASDKFNFPSREIETLRLYKNGKPLSGYGRPAFVRTLPQASWSNSINELDTLILSVDGTAKITYTFPDQIFADYTEFTSTSSANTLTSWVTVMNKILTGVTASIDGTSIRLTSNRGLDSQASVEIDPTSTLVTANMFDSAELSAVGLKKDYTLDRNTAELELVEPLAKGDMLTAGTNDTFAQTKSSDLLGASVSLVQDAHLWILTDDSGAEQIVTPLAPGITVTVSNPSSNTIRFTTSTAMFNRIRPGDYFINSSDAFSASNRIEGRVSNKDAGNTWFELVLTNTESPTPEVINYIDGFSFTRSTKPPQRIVIPASTYNLYDLSNTVNQSLIGAYFEVEDDLRMVLRSRSFDADGSVMIQHINTAAEPFGFAVGEQNESEISLSGFVKTDKNQIAFPYFVHSEIASGGSANPPDSVISTITTQEILPDENALLRPLNPYGLTDGQGVNAFSQIKNITGSTIDLSPSELIKRLRTIDRVYSSRPYQFGPDSNLVVILDKNPSERTFYIPMYRNIETNSTHVNNASAFNAYDVDFGPMGNLNDSFGSEYSFDNYVAYMRAKFVVDQPGDENAILYRSTLWGKSGEYYSVSYVYPQNPNQDISHLVSTTTTTDVQIILPSGAPITTQIDGTTEWNVTITPNTPAAGVDMVSITYSGTGTPPALTISGGEYVKIRDSGEFQEALVGTHRVSDEAGFTPSANGFSFPVKAGTIAPESNRSSLVPNTVTFFASEAVSTSSHATAEEISEYVNSELPPFITATLSDDNGTSGSGVIVYSTEEVSNFTKDRDYLLDGQNTIETTDLDGLSQFSFKTPLSYISGQGYSFNEAEPIRLVPTTPKHVVEFLNTLSVTGLSTLAFIVTADDESFVQIASHTSGSEGAVQIAGGAASQFTLDVINVASSEGSMAKVPTLTAQANSFSAGQIVKIEADEFQEKSTSINAQNTILTTPNSPAINQSTITIGNRQSDQLLFGHKRIDINTDVTWKVEKQGPLVCISWNGAGSAPNLTKIDNCNFNSADTFTATAVTPFTLDLVATGNTDFRKIEINDYVNISSVTVSGRFKVVGKGFDYKTIRILTDGSVQPFTSVQFSSITAELGVREGDSVVISSGFDPLNQGRFTIIRTFNDSFWIENSNAIEEEVALTSTPVAVVIPVTNTFTVAPAPDGSVTRISSPSADFSSAHVGDTLTFESIATTVVAVGSTYVEVSTYSIAAGVYNDAVVSVSRPAMTFSQYDAAALLDSFVFTGNFFQANVGKHAVVRTLSPNQLVVSSVLAPIDPANPSTPVIMGVNADNAYLEEGIKYKAYKEIEFITAEPNNPDISYLMLNSDAQVEKINAVYGVSVNSVSRLSFPSTTTVGLDAYRHDVGLLAEVNRVVYGDPRDNTTYPGIAAAGADIFIDPPLTRRVQVGLSIRLKTGIPLAAIVEQIRSSVSALIDSNPIGESIAISSIVAAVEEIPGVRALAVTSPLYDSNNDMIVIQPKEKSRVLNPVADISVSAVQ